ncbi:MAG: glycosyltransferase family 39 protein [Bryobacteraceae bacterium]
MSTSGRPVPVTRGEILCLLLILAAATALRIPGLNSDLWLDEVIFLINGVRSPVTRLLSEFSTDNTHVLYALAAKASVSLFGESPFSMRIPAALLGLASLSAVWRLGRAWTAPREALLAAALLTVSFSHVWFSQNARGYTGLLLATVFSTDLYLRGRQSARTGTWILYAVTVTLGMWMHLTMVFVAMAHGLVAAADAIRLRSMRAGAWKPFGAVLLAGLLTLFVYSLALTQMFTFFGRPSGGASRTDSETQTTTFLLTQSLDRFSGGHAAGLAAAGGGALVLVIGVVSYWRREKRIAVLFLLPAVLGLVCMVGLGRNLWPRFFFNSAGFGVLLAIRGISVLSEEAARRWPRWGAAAWPAMASVLLIGTAFSLRSVYAYPKQDFTGARDFVQGLLGPSDCAVGVDVSAYVYSRHYAPHWKAARNIAQLAEAQCKGVIYVVYTLPRRLRAVHPELFAHLEANYTLVRVFPGTLADGTVYVRRSRD